MHPGIEELTIAKYFWKCETHICKKTQTSKYWQSYLEKVAEVGEGRLKDWINSPSLELYWCIQLSWPFCRCEVVLISILVCRYKLGEFCNTGSAELSLCRNAEGAEVLIKRDLGAQQYTNLLTCIGSTGKVEGSSNRKISGGMPREESDWAWIVGRNGNKAGKMNWRNGGVLFGERRKQQDNLLFFCVKN